MDTEEELDPFPFNLSDFVTVDEVGDVAELPLPPSPTPAMETSLEDAPTPVQTQTEPFLTAVSDEKTPPASGFYGVMSYFQVASVTADAADATLDPDNPTAACEQTPPEQAQPPVTAPPEEGEHASHSSGPGPDAQQNQEDNDLLRKEEQDKEEQDKEEQVKDPSGDVTPAVGSGTTDDVHLSCFTHVYRFYMLNLNGSSCFSQKRKLQMNLRAMTSV